MPTDNAIGQMSQVKSDARDRVAEAVSAIISLCWDDREPGFSFSGHLALLREANKILSEMSDGILSDCERRAAIALAEAELDEYGDDALEFSEGETAGETVLFRLDRQADHLRDLLAGWLAVAAVAGLTKSQTESKFWTYIGNPSASKEWRNAGLSNPKWGSGFQINVLDGIVVIGQDLINRVFQFARIAGFRNGGAVGYRTVRQSSYDCPYCDDMCERIWPLDYVALPYHPRCVCKAIPVYADELL